ncbi:hypothetical protein NDU88_006428 [Pleurodeles waltl]|uniref:Uncharacterized protein n=1 Tax=Pleurodeles waltl TaxID=8319 RepID=A0AAV7PKZ9_PLEWA|nr:hypothetical protein NDU88_006428 [Pleurodeles waltl]
MSRINYIFLPAMDASATLETPMLPKASRNTPPTPSSRTLEHHKQPMWHLNNWFPVEEGLMDDASEELLCYFETIEGKVWRADATESLATTAEVTLMVFGDYYEHRNACRPQLTPEFAQLLLFDVPLYCLTRLQQKTLDEPITKDEIQAAIRDLKTAKTRRPR